MSKVIVKMGNSISTYSITGNEVAKTKATENGAYGFNTEISNISIVDFSKELLRLENEGAYIEYL